MQIFLGKLFLQMNVKFLWGTQKFYQKMSHFLGQCKGFASKYKVLWENKCFAKECKISWGTQHFCKQMQNVSVEVTQENVQAIFQVNAKFLG